MIPYSKTQLDALLLLVNQTFDLDRKTAQDRSLHRHVDRMARALSTLGLVWHDPLGEPYDETRTDCEASIAGESADNLVVIEVVKPIVYWQGDQARQIVQRGVVVVQGRPALA